MSKPKIYIFIVDVLNEGRHVVSAACAEDGTSLAEHLSSALIYVRHDMGLVSKAKHRLYDQHYPEGWELVDLTDLSEPELAVHPGLNEALDKGIKTLDASKSEGPPSSREHEV